MGPQMDAAAKQTSILEPRPNQFPHPLAYPETTSRAMFNLHARVAFSSSSGTETVNLHMAETQTWKVKPECETTVSGAMLHGITGSTSANE